MTSQVHFDDRLKTIVDQGDLGLPARTSAWSQLADILAQDKGQLSAYERDTALALLDKWRADVPFERRRSVATALAHRQLPIDLATTFARDLPAIAAPILASIALSDAEWLLIIPSLPPASRALIRGRRDLPESAIQCLNSYGASDFALASSIVTENTVPLPPRATQISDLVARIDAFQRDRSRRLMPEAQSPSRSKNFRFETSDDGVINWVEGAPREAILGLSLSEMAAPGDNGVDGVSAGAFRQRSEIRDANLHVGGEGHAAGQWIITAKPIFEMASGRLTGYRGVAKRRNIIIGQYSAVDDQVNNGLTPDFARQLVHELRTPLNAISGFSEMISQQLLGPVAQTYRQKANEISKQAAKMMMVFDDLDSDARLATGNFEANKERTADVKLAILDVVAFHEAEIDDRDVTLRLALASDCAAVAIDPRTLERLIDRMLMIVVGAASPTEVITLRLTSDDGTFLSLDIDRPQTLRGMSDENLLDPAFEQIDHSNSTPALGVAFSLRLIGKLVQAFEGRFTIGHERFTLILPIAHGSAAKTKESS